ncbi:unnamed protein product [Owenia fusiformis]|uniref:Uncharacterized protein n=1 Tax=Owenia fusiformis TaxID=6347 RepID=A0A8J1TMX0_OWEFU|nr:unnamed protein product [Owenia fusiformis]
MSCEEQQQEEVEVLQSIYDGDTNYIQVNDTTFQYKVGEHEHHKSFLVEVQWGEQYPEELPSINLDAFYNKHVLQEIKDNIVEKIRTQAEEFQGCAMTYTLFEFAKENAEEFMVNQPEFQTTSDERNIAQEDQVKQVKQKKEQLTKAQKRKIINRVDNTGELPRGHDWIDVVKHLHQTGRGDNNS